MLVRCPAFLDSFVMKCTLLRIAMTYLASAQHIFEKMFEILKYPVSWIAGFFLFLVNSVAGGQLIIYIVVLASVIDLVCGIAVSVKRKKFTLSDLMRRTVEKVTVYGLALLIFLCIDRLVMEGLNFNIALSSGIVGVLITLAETWSFLASLLILYPNNAVLKLLQKKLTGEIASKLDIEENEVSAALDSMVKKSRIKKQPRNSNGQFVRKNV